MAKRNILIVSFTFHPKVNGVAAVVMRHAEYFVSLGHDVTVLTGHEDGMPRHSTHNGISVVRFDAKGTAHLFHGLHGEIQPYLDYLLQWQGDVAFFHCWGIWTTDAALGILDKLRYKKVMVSHGFDYQMYPRNVRFPRGLRHWLGWQPYVRLLPSRLKRFERLVCLSDSTEPRFYYDHMIAAKHVPDSVKIISSGIDVKDFEASDHGAAPRVSGKKEVLVVGNYFQNHKHQELALRAFAEANIEEACITFIGSTLNEYTDYLSAESEKLGIADRVFLDHSLTRHEVIAAYLRCDLVVCSSIWESGPIVLLESMASGKPFVSTNVGFAASLQGGLIAKDQADMAGMIRYLLTDSIAANSLGISGKKQAHEKFDWSIVLRAYGHLLDELMT